MKKLFFLPSFLYTGLEGVSFFINTNSALREACLALRFTCFKGGDKLCAKFYLYNKQDNNIQQ